MTTKRTDLEPWPDDGLPSHVREYLEWYVIPEFAREELELPKSIADWCRAHGFHRSAPTSWMRDPRFRKELEKEYASANVDPSKVQEIVDAMHKEAKRGDTKAAALYLQYIDRLKPQRIIIEDQGIEKLSDEEFARVLANHLEFERRAVEQIPELA